MRVFDNGGKTYCRYTVFPWGNDECLFLSHDCYAPNGVSMYESGRYPDKGIFGKEITFAELPEMVREHVRARVAEMTDGYPA